MWKGVLDSGKTGYFSSEDTATYLEIKSLASPGILRNKSKIVRRESSRKSSRNSKKLDVTMISGPQDDLRHTGHIGYDGAVFGDVSFIGNNYNRLPANVGPNGMTSSVMSLPKPETEGELHSFNHSQSDACILNSLSGLDTSVSQVSASSNECMTDTSQTTTNTSTEAKYEDVDDFDSFKIPELSVGSSFDLGFGGSLMDEVMKALTVTESRETTPVETDSLANEKSPLLEKDTPFYSSKNTFDNVAMMAADQDTEVSEKGSSEVSRSQELAQSPPKTPVLPEPQEKKKKPKLRIQIPGLGSRQKGMRSLSESEERQMDEAIELANSYAMKRASDHMTTPSPKSLDSQSDRSHGESDGNGTVSSPKGRSVFNLRKKSPKQERKTTFTDEIASISDASEEVSAEAQEAYNMLIVRGSIKESRSGRPSLEKRGQRDHDSSTETIEKPALAPRANRNIRAPQGIPGRHQQQVLQETSADSNPLRRLREGAAIIPPKTRPKPGSVTTDLPSPTKQQPQQQPNISANRSFFDKLKEQELSQDSGEGSEEESLSKIFAMKFA